MNLYSSTRSLSTSLKMASLRSNQSLMSSFALFWFRQLKLMFHGNKLSNVLSSRKKERSWKLWPKVTRYLMKLVRSYLKLLMRMSVWSTVRCYLLTTSTTRKTRMFQAAWTLICISRRKSHVLSNYTKRSLRLLLISGKWMLWSSLCTLDSRRSAAFVDLSFQVVKSNVSLSQELW